MVFSTKVPAATEWLSRSLTMSSAAKGGGKVSPEDASDRFHAKSTKYDEGLAAATVPADTGEPGSISNGIPEGGLVAVDDREVGNPGNAPFRGPESPAVAALSSGLEPQRPAANTAAPDPEAAVIVAVSPTDHEVLK